MNTLRRISSGPCAALILASVLWPEVGAAASPPVRTVRLVDAVVRDHHLFVGVDPYLRHDRELLPVRRFEGEDTILRRPTGDELTVVENSGFRLQMRPKVSPIAVQIDALTGQTTFSPWTDPTGQWMARQQAMAAQYGDQMDAANRELGRAMDRMAQAENLENTGGAVPVTESSQGIAAQAASNYQAKESTVKMLNDPTVSIRQRNALGERKGAEDTIELRFNLSAPEVIADAHVLAWVRIRTDADGFRDLSFQRPIGDVGPSVRAIRISQSGLPPGFDFVSAQLHVFCQTEEVATNLSERHLELTAAEARQYELLDHLAQNRDATLPAQPMWSLAPEALRAAQDPSRYDFRVEVEVDAEGLLLALHPGENQILPAPVRTVFEQLPYLPALQDGKPVAGKAVVNLVAYFR